MNQAGDYDRTVSQGHQTLVGRKLLMTANAAMGPLTCNQFHMTTTDGLRIACARWSNRKPPGGILQIPRDGGSHRSLRDVDRRGIDPSHDYFIEYRVRSHWFIANTATANSGNVK